MTRRTPQTVPEVESLALIAIAVAIVAWSVSAGALLWHTRQRRRLEAASASAIGAVDPLQGGAIPAGVEETETAPEVAVLDGATAGAASHPIEQLDPEIVDSISRGLVVGLGDEDLAEAQLMLTALGDHGRVMVGSGGADRETRARRMVTELSARAQTLGVGPPILGVEGDGVTVFEAARGACAPLLKAAQWELSARKATREAATRSASDLPAPKATGGRAR